MRNFFRWHFWRKSAKHWRRRYLELQAQFEAEVWRNREREDTLITVPMRAMGMFGMQPRTAPARIPQKVNPLTRHASPYDALTTEEKYEFEGIWRPDAEARGIDINQAKQQFAAVVASRRSLSDEPLM